MLLTRRFVCQLQGHLAAHAAHAAHHEQAEGFFGQGEYPPSADLRLMPVPNRERWARGRGSGVSCGFSVCGRACTGHPGRSASVSFGLVPLAVRALLSLAGVGSPSNPLLPLAPLGALKAPVAAGAPGFTPGRKVTGHDLTPAACESESVPDRRAVSVAWRSAQQPQPHSNASLPGCVWRAV